MPDTSRAAALDSERSAQAVAAGAARDLALYDSEGCLSLHALFVERGGAVSPERFGEFLASALDRAAVELPIGRRSHEPAARVAMARDLATFRASTGRVYTDAAGSYLLVVEPPDDEPPLFLPRTLGLCPVDAPADAVSFLDRHRIAIEALAVAGPATEMREIACALRAARIANFGALQAPPLGGFHGGAAAHRRVRSLDLRRNVSGDDLDLIQGPVPGPRTAELAALLSRHESRNVTFLSAEYPVFWASASGSTVTDVDGNRYIDLTAAFGAANAGHSNPAVASAISEQAGRLMHGLGDVHPSEIRVRLLERLAQIVPRGLAKTFLASTGSEAVEAALKTAMLATGKFRFASYAGAYHGLSLGTLAVGGIERFREPFAAALGQQALLLDYPREGASDAREAAAQARELLVDHDDIAGLLIEPIQGRAGCIVPPDGYLTAMRGVCDELGILMIADEIYTGFGRTGEWFAVDRERVVPDILCVGKAMGSGFPISAAIGRAPVMEAWPLSTGEALHTSTHLGNPLGCAAALATIDELERGNLPARAARLGRTLGARARSLACVARRYRSPRPRALLGRSAARRRDVARRRRPRALERRRALAGRTRPAMRSSLRRR